MALINLESEISVFNSIYVSKLSFQMQKTDVCTIIIDNFLLKIHSMIIVVFKVL